MSGWIDTELAAVAERRVTCMTRAGALPTAPTIADEPCCEPKMTSRSIRSGSVPDEPGTIAITSPTGLRRGFDVFQLDVNRHERKRSPDAVQVLASPNVLFEPMLLVFRQCCDEPRIKVKVPVARLAAFCAPFAFWIGGAVDHGP